MRNKKQFVKISSERLDTATGELQTHVKTVSYNVKVDNNFCKLYTDHLSILNSLNATALKVLFYLCRNMNYDNMVALAEDDRALCAKEFNVSVKAINKEVTMLNKTKVIARRGRGKYMVNPELASKGSAERAVNLREQWTNIFQVKTYD